MFKFIKSLMKTKEEPKEESNSGIVSIFANKPKEEKPQNISSEKTVIEEVPLISEEDKKHFEVTEVVEEIKAVIEQEQEQVKKEEQLIENVIYEITWINAQGDELTYFTSKPIKFKFNFIKILEPFKKLTLQETVLNKRVIKVDCKSEEEVEDIELEISNGIFIKIIPADQEWIYRDYTNTKDLFDKLVLQTFREINAKIPLQSKTPQNKAGLKEGEIAVDLKQPVKQNRTISLNQPGNLPVNRPPINW